MPLRALSLVPEHPQAGPSNRLKRNSSHDKHGSTLLSLIHHDSVSRPSSLRSSIVGFFPNSASSERRVSTANPSTARSSRVSLPQSDVDLGPGLVPSHPIPFYSSLCSRTALILITRDLIRALLIFSHSTTRSSVHSPTPSFLQTTSGTDYAASSPPLSPPPVVGVVPSIQTPTSYTHLIRGPPEPEPPPELDENGRPRLRLNTKFPAVGTALRYYKPVSEDEDEDEDEEEGEGSTPPGKKDEHGGGKRSKLKTDWKTNPRAKPGRRKDRESTKNPLYAPTRATPPVRFVKEEDHFAKWLEDDAFWAGKTIPKVEFGWRKRSAVEIAE
jgi:hypothetical protein